VTPLVQLEVADHALGLRGKVVRADKAGPGKRPAFCTIIYGLDAADDVADTMRSSAANGYPDGQLLLDEDTRVALPWRRNTSAVLATMVDENSVAMGEDPRGLVASLTSRLAEYGVSPVLGYEYELHLFERPDGEVRRIEDLVPFSRLHNAYSLSRSATLAGLAEEFVDRMDAIGVPVEAVHAELGHGFFEFALGPAPAVRAADSAARAKEYFKELATERGLLASFMAKPRVDASGAGGHVHQSITRNGVNVFCEAPGQLSTDGRAYLAGLLDTMADSTLLMCPTPNSYRRLSAEHFVSETVTWGWDNRNAACRVIGAGPLSEARVEHRRPGADASPYVVAAALLAGGLWGLRERPDLGEPLGRGPSSSRPPLPNTMRDAIAALRDSPRATDLLGPDFVKAFLATRASELAKYDAWVASRVTEWEIARYLEAL